MAAIWRASARLRLPISARSRARLRSRRRRCWSRCRSRRRRVAPTATPSARARRATACSTAWRRPAWCLRTRSRAPRRKPCRMRASCCRCWRRRTPTSIVSQEPDIRVHRLTIDASLQKSLQELARQRARAIGPHISVAILAVDNATGEVRARVASADFFDARRAGQVDMSRALRSPGSALKPFIYGLGFEDGLIHPATLIDDRPVRYGGYMPHDFDNSFQGTVTVRQALQWSLNVPAIAVLDKVGVDRLTARLSASRRSAGAAAGPGARSRHRARRRRHHAQRPGDALYRARAAGHGRAADRAGRRRRRKAAAPADRCGRRLVCRQYPDRRAAAGERRARPHRLQDRHFLRLSRRLGGRLSTAA